MSPGRALPSKQALNSDLTAKMGRPVILFEVLPVAEGDVLRLRFVSHKGKNRQGVWLAVDGLLEVAGSRHAQLKLWHDATPREVDLKVVSTRDGLLRLYNMWDKLTGFGPMSQGATSGMLLDRQGDTLRYSCQDSGLTQAFDSLVIELQVPDVRK